MATPAEVIVELRERYGARDDESFSAFARRLHDGHEDYRLGILSVYSEACPGWATDGNPVSMAENAKRYREGLEDKIKRLQQVLEKTVALAGKGHIDCASIGSLYGAPQMTEEQEDEYLLDYGCDCGYKQRRDVLRAAVAELQKSGKP